MKLQDQTRNVSRLITHLKLVALGLSCALANVGCGQGFPVKGLSSSNQALEAPNGELPNGAAEWKNLQVDGSISGGNFDKTSVIGIDKSNKELILRLPMTANPFLDGLSLNIPIAEIPGARIALDPLPQGGSALALRIPLAHVLRGVSFLPASRLPNGDPLPAIPSGELPSTAVQLNNSKNIRATVYLAPTVVGVFVNTPFDPLIRLTLPIRNESRTKTWGYFTSIPAKPQSADGGFFISIALPDDIARVIDDHL